MKEGYAKGKVPSKSLRDAKIASSKQNSQSSSSAKEYHEAGPGCIKRRHSVAHTDDAVSKRLRKDSEVPNGLQESRQDELFNSRRTNQHRKNLPRTLLRLMYQLDLSVLCSLRKMRYKHKYPSLSLAFEDSEIDTFNDIVLRYEGKSIHVRIETVDKYYTNNDIRYIGLFTKEKEKQSSFINNYFDGFVKFLMSELYSPSTNVEYLVIYTNSSLDLTEEKMLKQVRSRNFYPFKFNSMNMDECEILKDFLFTNDNAQGHGFYQFSRDKTIRRELYKRLEFSPAMQKAIKDRNISLRFENRIKRAFLKKLVFAVNQPSREELNSIIRSEMKGSSGGPDNCIRLRESILSNLATPGKHKKLGRYVFRIIYEFNLLMLFLHDMFLDKNIFSINFEGKRHEIDNNITINYRDRITYVKAHYTDSDIGYSELFPSVHQREKNTFSVNKHIALFLEGSASVKRYFIIYTNADLNLTEEKRLKMGKSKCFYPLKFDCLDIQKKRYKILRNCSCINENGLYQFAEEEATREKVLGLLQVPSFTQKGEAKGRHSDWNEKELKEKLLSRLIFAVKQHDKEELNNVIRIGMSKADIPYNHEELREIALRWLESHEFGHITKEIMEKLLEDIKNNRSSYQKIQDGDINEEMKFAKSVVGRQGTSTVYQFLGFLVKGDGKRYLEVLKRARINLSNVSSILSKAGNNPVKAFKGLYDLWFDEKGNKTKYLKTLEREGMKLVCMSGILNGAGNNAVESFRGLFDLWFDEKGNKTQYLKNLEKEGIKLTNMSSILNGAGNNAVEAFKELHNLWFDEKGNKTRYLNILEKEGMNLANMSSILNGARNNAVNAFKGLYDLWFDEKGNKTQYLKTLEKEGINLSKMSSILHAAGNNAVNAFKGLYDLWFDEKGNKTQYLKTLEKEGIKLSNMSSILNKAGKNAVNSFQELYDLWFDKKGNKTQYLKTLEKEGTNLGNMSGILNKAGKNAVNAFKGLYDLWFDENGNKTQYLKTLEKEGLNLTNMSGILNGAGNNAVEAFKGLYNLWFDEMGNKTQYLKIPEKEGINLANISSILSRTGNSAVKAFKELYYVWFDAEGNKTQYLNTLEKEGICLTNISSILHGAATNAAKAFKELYNTFFDEQGNKKEHLKHFIEENERNSFTLHNLSSILSNAGCNPQDAFEKLHSVCFNDDGKRTKLLDDFYKADFKASHLSSMLCATGLHADSALKRLHSVWLNNEGEKTKLLDDFYEVGFTPGHLCNMLSGAVGNLEKFHDFCFVGETKKYLNHFLNEKEGFTPSHLCNILHGARANVCSAFRDFCNVCYDETGDKTQLLDDFYKAGFTPINLSRILSMTGNNAAFILRNFHKSCFDKRNYLNHFLAEKKLFTPSDLCKILRGAGINTCVTFEKLHNLCFDKDGNKTEYLNKLIENDQGKICDILYKEVKKHQFLR